jgi:hypothetical protein
LGDFFTDTEFRDMIRKLAFEQCTDLLRLFFPDEDIDKLPEDLDLRIISEIKRDSKGNIGVRLIDRIELIKLLSSLDGKGQLPEASENRAESFYSALDRAAARLEDEQA